MPPELLGPTGLLIGLAIAVAALWRDHLRADADDRSQRDQAQEANRALEASLARLAAAIEQDNRDRAARHRAQDP